MLNLEYRLLDDKEIASALASVPSWSLEEGQLTRTWTFQSYAAGVMFAAAVGQVADHLDHHPDIFVGYQKVRLGVNTHSVKGISPYDFELARRVDAIG